MNPKQCSHTSNRDNGIHLHTIGLDKFMQGQGLLVLLILLSKDQFMGVRSLKKGKHEHASNIRTHSFVCDHRSLGVRAIGNECIHVDVDDHG